MALYNLAKYGVSHYGIESVSSIVWILEIDWNDDGVFEGAESNRILDCRISRGRDFFLSSSGDRFEPVRVGTLEITLNNYDDKYNPYNTSSPLYPNIAPGRLIRLRVRNGTTTYSVYAGTVQDIIPNSESQTITIYAEDGIRWLQDVTVSTDIYQSIFANDAISTILSAVYWPSAWGSSLQSGADLLDYWWANGNSALDEISAISDSEFGRVYCDASGAFRFRNRHESATSLMTLDQAQLDKNITLAQPWEIQRNIVKVTINNYSADLLGPIWTYSGAIQLAVSQVIVLNVEYPSSINIITPLVAGTDYIAYRWPDETGPNLTAGVSVVASAVTSHSATLTITHLGGAYHTAINITTLQIRGQAITATELSNTAYGTGFDKHPRSMDTLLTWQQVDENAITFPGQLMSLLNTSPGLPTISIDTRPDLQFLPDLFDRITLTSAKLNINADYRIGQILHEWTAETGQGVRTTFKLEPYWPYGYWLFNSNNELGVAQLGW